MHNKKVAILFFGLSRTLERTIDSLERNLFTPLRESSMHYDIFVHTYKIHGAYSNMWSNEHTENYHNEDVENLLKPKYYLCDDQEQIANSIDFNEYYTKLGNWTGMSEEVTKYLIRNMCLALYSKKQITLVLDQHMNEYDYAMIIRPDTEMHSRFNVNIFNDLPDNGVIIPVKEWFWGCNDRLCIARPHIISYCGKLFDGLKEYSENKSIISEVYFQDKLNERSITIVPKEIEYCNLRI